MSAPVCVAVVCWNSRELLDACLSSLRPDAESGLADVWVVDNASEDGSADLAAERHGWAKLIRSPENLGFGRAVNLVAEQTDNEWIAPANADLELRPGAVGALLEAGRADRRAGILAPRLIMPSGATQHSVHSFPGPLLALIVNSGAQGLDPIARRYLIEGSWDPDRSREVDWAHGAFLMVRREAWQQIGGFDPGQWMYAEDIDIAWRARRAGWSVAYVSRAAIRHEVSEAATRAFGPERLARHFAATYDWLERRRGRAAMWLTAALNLAGAAVRWALWTPLSLLSPDRAGRSRVKSGKLARAHLAAVRDRRALTRPPTERLR